MRDAFYFGSQVMRMHVNPRLRVPLSVHVSLTNRCSNRCRYCRFERLSQTDVWTTAALLKVLGEMKASGARRIQFTGGEPMLRDDLGVILRAAKSQGMFVGLSTNGYRVAERIEELAAADVVQVSYDGPPAVHALLRGKKSVDEALAAIKALLARKIPVWTNTVLTTVNAGCVDAIVAFAKERGIPANFVLLDYFEEPRGHFHPARREIEELILAGDARRKTIARLISLKKSGAPIGGSIPYFENALAWPEEERVTSSRPSPLYRCWAGRATAHLEADGKLSACGMGVGRVEGEDVIGQGFAAAWRKIR
ncbi:MAG: radical SAM protein, partial [Candidatus Aureabacteria bacterium]|nr:radical SAM protein [Candidatus Auribacterota bacterium]